ncbi:MAG TPA: hypothetical protein VGP07_07550 [Polyangia bacterium]
MTGSRAAARHAIDGRRRTRVALWGTLAFLGPAACRGHDAPTLAAPFSDTFERDALGADWLDTGGDYHVTGGMLRARNGYNHPAWLRKRLPPNVALELDVQSNSAAGDIKIELYGDGHSFDPDRGGYVSTGYVLIFGGWHNALSVICRNNEHDEGRKAMRTTPRVTPGQRYHFTVTRQNGRIDWQIDGAPFLTWTDPEPLEGAGHDFFAVNDWEADVSFDNLTIRPLP